MQNHLLSIMRFITSYRVLLPFYHAISDEKPVHIKHLYPLFHPKQFESDLEGILKLFKPISMEHLVQCVLNDQPLPKNHFMLSFDDGLREFGEIAFPILQKKGIPVALFVNPAFVDTGEMFYRLKTSLLIEQIKTGKADLDGLSVLLKSKDIINSLKSINYRNRFILDTCASFCQIDFQEYQKENRPYLTLQELKSLQNKGVYMGNHSYSHPLFSELSIHEQLEQVEKGQQWISEHLSPQIPVFSFPFTDYGIPKQFFENMADGNPLHPKITFGCAGMKHERILTHFQRIPMDSSTNSAGNVLLKQYLYYSAKAFLGKNSIHR